VNLEDKSDACVLTGIIILEEKDYLIKQKNK